MSPKRVLSIQSHVAYGYVGGKAAVFPLQCLGYDVDVVNTVNFSNHSGYGRFGGTRTTAQDLTVIFETMAANKLLSQDRVLTGYIPGAEALSAIAFWVKQMKTQNPKLTYLLDPVLGDSGRLYVAPDVIPIYRSLLPHASIITPNWFEIETLTGVKLDDFESLRKALRLLHREHGVTNVVMSSMPFQAFLRSAVPSTLIPSNDRGLNIDNENKNLICLSSSRTSEASDNIEASVVHAHVLPCIPGYFSGVGDLFSALVLAHFEPPQEGWATHVSPESQATPLSRAASLALSKTFAILRRTHELCTHPRDGEEEILATDEECDRQDPERRVTRMRRRELRLIEAQDLLRSNPEASLRQAMDSGDVKSTADEERGDFVRLRELQLWPTFWSQDS